MIDRDVVIVGGGIVGLVTALAVLDATNLTVTLLDDKKSPLSFDGDCYSNRVSAITLGSYKFLSQLGVTPLLAKRRISSFNQVFIHDSESTLLRLDANDIGKKTLGCIIENDLLSAALFERLQDYPVFQFEGGVSLQSLTRTRDALILTSPEKEYRTRLLIGADGKGSWVRKTSGIPVLQHAYQVNAIVATVKTEKPHDNIARQYFLKTGPLAFLPLHDVHYASIVWSLPTGDAFSHMELSTDDFEHLLMQHSYQQLGHIELQGTRLSLPLFKQEAMSYSDIRTVLLGDAAHVVHPLAGQGVNLSLQDVRILQEELVSASHNQRDFAGRSVLRRYERRAKAATYDMKKAIDLVQHAFVDKNTEYGAMRRAALHLLQTNGFLRRSIMRFASSL